MAKTEVIPWAIWRSKEDLKKKEQIQAKVTKVAKKCLPVALAILAGVTIGTSGDLSVFASGIPDNAVASMANVNPSTNFISDLHTALSPLRDLVKGFGHEIYGIFMLWGAIEVMIDKAQQGFNRMKVATLGYVLLVWAPRIVEWITGSVG